MTDCFVCPKHRDRGRLIPDGPVAEDELVLASHTVTPEVLGSDDTTAYLGHLFVEPLAGDCQVALPVGRKGLALSS